MARPRGIEPRLLGLEASVLPLNERRMEPIRRVELRPVRYKGTVLPLNYTGMVPQVENRTHSHVFIRNAAIH